MPYQILSTDLQNMVTIPELKNYLRISHDYDDLWLSELIYCAIGAAENFMRIKLLGSKIKVDIHHLENSEVRLYGLPISEIIEVVAKGEQEVIFAPESYYLEDNILKFKEHRRAQDLIIEYIVGYKDQTKIPAAIRQGVLLHIAEMYDSRGASASISGEVQKLYQPYRKMMV